jgi:DNA replication protein
VLPNTGQTKNMSELVFSGFPSRAEVTPIPNLFFTEVMPQIGGINELKVVLHVFWLLSRRRGYPQFVTGSELSADPILMGSIEALGVNRGEALSKALKEAVDHGIILHVGIEKAGTVEDAYLINNDYGRDAVKKITQGDLADLPAASTRGDVKAPVLDDIFSLYEQNIGMLTPLVAEQLQEAKTLYPPDWIEAAFKEAVALNKRSWKYIVRILERWATEGKDDGKFGRDTQKGRDREKYVKGKYGHMVKG